MLFRSQATPPADARLMAERIPGSRWAVIPNAAHLANLEQPDTFPRLLAEFAAGLKH